MSEFTPYYYDTRQAHENRYEERLQSLDLSYDCNCHTVVDSFERHHIPRWKQELSRKESAFAELSTFNSSEFHEKIIVQAVQMLIKTDKFPNPDESLSDFIDRIFTENF